ncbi:hypothetical protein [Pseudomonas sp. GM17]|nr:hypothetical protein [Pseudomonas sp. GM17]WIE49842.1 hypothetical protein PMI20_029780 [Pseudomonas sp. GM17]
MPETVDALVTWCFNERLGFSVGVSRGRPPELKVLNRDVLQV